METLKEIFREAGERVRDFFGGLSERLSRNPNAKRWIVEGCLAAAIGIIVGCVTFNVLKDDKKKLNVRDKSIEATAGEEQLAKGEGLPPDDPDSDVVIEVIEGEAPQEVSQDSYAPPVNGWSPEEIEAAINERGQYRDKNKYQGAVTGYWEGTRGITATAGYCTYLFKTDKQMYSAADFEGLSPEVIHVAKNEIYARHGYSFKDPDLYNYFMGQVWYTPSVMPADFSEKTFNETEVKNLNVLNSLDTL